MSRSLERKCVRYIFCLFLIEFNKVSVIRGLRIFCLRWLLGIRLIGACLLAMPLSFSTKLLVWCGCQLGHLGCNSSQLTLCHSDGSQSQNLNSP